MTAIPSFESDRGRVTAFPARHAMDAKGRRAYSRFRDALLAFSETPNADTAVRYLAASRALRPTDTSHSQDSELPPAA